jgi:hypothetical protein
MSWLAAASSSRSLRWPISWDAIEMRGVLEGTAARLAAERLTHDRELDPLRRLRDGLDAMRVPTFDSSCPLSGPERGLFIRRWDLAKSPMLRRMMERVLALPFAFPEPWCLPAPSSAGPRAEGIAVA